jgi:tetratricopeptide (TPR) repeat protein
MTPVVCKGLNDSMCHSWKVSLAAFLPGCFVIAGLPAAQCADNTDFLIRNPSRASADKSPSQSADVAVFPTGFDIGADRSSQELVLAWKKWLKQLSGAIYQAWNGRARSPGKAVLRITVSRNRVLVPEIISCTGDSIFRSSILSVFSDLNGNPGLTFPANSERQNVSFQASYSAGLGLNPELTISSEPLPIVPNDGKKAVENIDLQMKRFKTSDDTEKTIALNAANAYKERRFDEAIRNLAFLLGKHPEDANAQFALGQSMRSAGDLGNALKHLRSAAALDPNALFLSSLHDVESLFPQQPPAPQPPSLSQATSVPYEFKGIQLGCTYEEFSSRIHDLDPGAEIDKVLSKLQVYEARIFQSSSSKRRKSFLTIANVEPKDEIFTFKPGEPQLLFQIAIYLEPGNTASVLGALQAKYGTPEIKAVPHPMFYWCNPVSVIRMDQLPDRTSVRYIHRRLWEQCNDMNKKFLDL